MSVLFASAKTAIVCLNSSAVCAHSMREKCSPAMSGLHFFVGFRVVHLDQEDGDSSPHEGRTARVNTPHPHTAANAQAPVSYTAADYR